MPVIPGRIVRLFALLALAALRHFLVHVELLAVIDLQMRGIDAGGLVRHRIAGHADGQAQLHGPFEVPGVESQPGLQQRRVRGKRLDVARMQARPRRFQALRRIGIRCVRIGELFPSHAMSPVKRSSGLHGSAGARDRTVSRS